MLIWSVWDLFDKSLSLMTLLPGGSRTLIQWLSWDSRRREWKDRRERTPSPHSPTLFPIYMGSAPSGAGL